MPKVERGIFLYDIQIGGSLTGVYRNEHVPVSEPMHTETARKRIPAPGIPGTYDVFWFDENNAPVNGTLTISPGQHDELVFEWRDNAGVLTFDGFGYRMNEHQIAGRYVGV